MAKNPKGNAVRFEGQQPLEGMTKTLNKGLDEAVKKSTALDKLYASMDKHVTNFTSKLNGGKSSSVLGDSLGSMGPGAVSSTIDAFRNGTYGSGGGLSGGQRLALGTMAVGSAGMAMLPGTMQAVSQRLSAEAIAMYSSGGASPRSIITGANKLVGNGATSMGGPTMAAGQILSQGGYGFGSVASNNIMSQVGGMSAVSGMSNQAVAGAYASQNGMLMLRMGVRFRDANGNPRPANEIVNELYNRLYRGGNPKNPELIYNPGSFEYHTIMAVAGGDPQRFELYASMLIARAKNNKPLTASQMQDAQGMLKTMGIKNSIQGTAFQFNTAQNRLLAASESGAVAGYQGSMQVAADVSNGMAALGETLPPVINALSAFKGVLESMPGMGGVGGTLSGLTGMATNALMMRAVLGGGGGLAKVGGKLGGAGSLVKGAAGKIGIAGLGLNIAGNALANGQPKGGARSRAGNAAKWASYASLLNFLGPEIGVPAMILAGAYGAATGGGENDNGAYSGSGSAHPMAASPAPNAVVTSEFGWREDPNNKGTRKHHNGIDYAMPVGSPVLAAADGTVVQIKNDGKRGYGLYLVIQHDGFASLYGHLTKSMVKVGQAVKQGELVAQSGGAKGGATSGNSTGPHLHFEVRQNSKSGSAENPKSFFGRIKQAVSRFLGHNKSSDSVSKSLWKSPVGTMSKGTAGYEGTRLAALLTQGGPLSYSDLSQMEKSGAVDWLGAHQSSNAKNKIMEGVLATDNTFTLGKDEGKGGIAFGSRKALVQHLYAQGFRGASLQTAFAIALAESGGRANAMGDVGLQDSKWGPSIGPFQIRSLKHPEKYGSSGQWRNPKLLTNPDYNLKAAWAISNKGKSWSAWSTYGSGAFTKYLDDAVTAGKQAGVPMGGSEEGYGNFAGTSAGLSQNPGGTIVVNNSGRGRDVQVTVNMDVRIANADNAGVQTMLHKFKSALESDATIKSLGQY